MGYSVACMAREPADILNKFIEHYIEADAEEIFLYYDGDSDRQKIINHEKLVVIDCNDYFWTDRKWNRPNEIVPRQKMIFNDAFSINKSDWLLICDADELVFGSLNDALVKIPKSLDFVRLRPYEAVWIEGEDVEAAFANSAFRRCAPRFLGKSTSFLTYGFDFKFFHGGIASHTQGKSIVRRFGSFSSMGVHAPRVSSEKSGSWLDDVFPNTDVRLCHYSAVTFNRWKVKLLGRFEGSRRDASVDHVARFSPAQAAIRTAFVQYMKLGKERELFDRIFVLRPRQVRVLRTLGLLEFK